MTTSKRALLALATTASLAAAPAGADAKTKLQVKGSTTMQQLVGKLGAAYEKTNKKVDVIVKGGQSDIGINAAAKGGTIGMASRDPLSGDPKGLAFIRVARDGVCMIVPPGNKLTNISAKQVKGIFADPPSITNWSDIPASGLSTPVAAVVRDPASGTGEAFRNIFLGVGASISGTSDEVESAGQMVLAVKNNPNAIGYSSLGLVTGVKTLSYEGVACTLQNAKSRQYKGLRNLWLVTKGVPKGEAAKFIAWATKSKTAKKIISSQKFLPR